MALPQDNGFVMPILDNVSHLAGQYFQYRQGERQRDVTGESQRTNFTTADGATKTGAEPTPVREQQAAESQGIDQQTLVIAGAVLVGAVVLVKVLK